MSGAKSDAIVKGFPKNQTLRWGFIIQRLTWEKSQEKLWVCGIWDTEGREYNKGIWMSEALLHTTWINPTAVPLDHMIGTPHRRLSRAFFNKFYPNHGTSLE